MLSKIGDILLYEYGFNTRSCSSCGITREIENRDQLHRDLCSACIHERTDQIEVWDGHGIDAETAATHREHNEYLCAVTGEWFDINDLTPMRVPVFDNRQSGGRQRATVPARVLDRPHITGWAKEACEINRDVKRGLDNSKQDRLRELRADRPGHPDRLLQNRELENNVYYGIPMNRRPSPSEKVIIYNGNHCYEKVPPRSDLLDISSESHDWGPSTSNHSGAVTAAGLIAHARDDTTASQLAYDLRHKLISSDRFKHSNGIWKLYADELAEWIDVLQRTT